MSDPVVKVPVPASPGLMTWAPLPAVMSPVIVPMPASVPPLIVTPLVPRSDEADVLDRSNLPAESVVPPL